jgi:hypothetical protein
MPTMTRPPHGPTRVGDPGRGGKPIVCAPKTAAGLRPVPVPSVIGDIEHHFANFAQPGPDGLLFPTAGGTRPTLPEGKPGPLTSS